MIGLAPLLLLLLADVPIALEVACAGVDAAEVRAVLALELRRPVREGDAPARARVECRGEVALLAVEDGGPPRSRALDLGGTAAVARPRLLALSLAELASAPPPVPARAAPPDPVLVAPAPLAVPGPPPLRLLAVGQARAFTAGPATLGLGLRAAGLLSARLGWQAEAAVERGSPAAAPGSVQLDGAGGAAALLGRAAVGRWTLAAGPGVRGGVLRLRGRPADPGAFAGQSVSAFTGGPALFAALAPPLAGRLAIELAAEAGYLMRPVAGYAGPERVVAVAGGWFGGTLGVGLGR